jgi:hypothetical protein
LPLFSIIHTGRKERLKADKETVITLRQLADHKQFSNTRDFSKCEMSRKKIEQ